ncbi:hypothetical protein V8C37DRAFT_61951 [Trichoderma ceciliae]
MTLGASGCLFYYFFILSSSPFSSLFSSSLLFFSFYLLFLSFFLSLLLFKSFHICSYFRFCFSPSLAAQYQLEDCFCKLGNLAAVG